MNRENPDGFTLSIKEKKGPAKINVVRRDACIFRRRFGKNLVAAIDPVNNRIITILNCSINVLKNTSGFSMISADAFPSLKENVPYSLLKKWPRRSCNDAIVPHDQCVGFTKRIKQGRLQAFLCCTKSNCTQKTN